MNASEIGDVPEDLVDEESAEFIIRNAAAHDDRIFPRESAVGGIVVADIEVADAVLATGGEERENLLDDRALLRGDGSLFRD